MSIKYVLVALFSGSICRTQTRFLKGLSRLRNSDEVYAAADEFRPIIIVAVPAKEIKAVEAELMSLRHYVIIKRARQ